jgi:hypothetical protein
VPLLVFFEELWNRLDAPDVPLTLLGINPHSHRGLLGSNSQVRNSRCTDSASLLGLLLHIFRYYKLSRRVIRFAAPAGTARRGTPSLGARYLAACVHAAVKQAGDAHHWEEAL